MSLTWGTLQRQCYQQFQSTLPVGGATPIFPVRTPGFGISIHAPRGGSDRPCPPGKDCTERFQSTLPVGGATCSCPQCRQLCRISIHAPRGGSDDNKDEDGYAIVISIHAPRGGSDFFGGFSLFRTWLFQSTLPVGGATLPVTWLSLMRMISIHAPRGGSDSKDAQISL